MEISFDNISITEGLFNDVTVENKPIIVSDRVSVNGDMRHLLFKVIDNVIQTEKTITLKTTKISDSELDDIYTYDGTNDVEITINGTQYTCTMSIEAPYRIMGQQLAREARVILKVISEKVVFVGVDGTMVSITDRYIQSESKNPDVDGSQLSITDVNV